MYTMQNFKDICKMSQKELKKHVASELRTMYKSVTEQKGFVYAQGTFPVLLVAHLDTVHTFLPGKIKYKKDKLWSPNGIGGDDRCGVYMILNIIEKYNCSVLFCQDEEVGCLGAQKFVNSELAKKLIGKFNYIIEFDRKGNNDAVFYDCDNKDFEKFITKDFYKTNIGSFTDISIVAPYLKAAAVNLSCGYYKAHTKEEYVMWSEMETSMHEAIKILARTMDDDKFEYIEAPKRFYDYGGYYGGDDGYYFIDYCNGNAALDTYETYAQSEEEAVGIFLIEHSDLCFGDVIEVYGDYENYKIDAWR